MLKPLLAGLLLSAWTLRAAPLSISVSPATITNNYVGSVLLSISNLSSAGATVRVDRILDGNSNGIIGASEPIVSSFYVTDGQEPLIGGVRNSNMPGDDDGLANQTIQSHVPYPGVILPLDHISGQYIYRVTDMGNGATATAILDLAQQILPQGVTGRIFTAGGTPLPFAPVVASAQNTDDGFGTVSDANGNYTIYTSPGMYSIFTVYPGQLANAGLSITVNSNVFLSNNLTNASTDGTTISGQVVDSATSIGLPGIPIEAGSSSGLGVFTFTGTNGAYTMLVNSDKWSVQLNSGVGTILGYCRGPMNKISTNATGAVSNINFQLIKGNALVYGTVTSIQSNAIPTITMQAQDTNGSVFDSQGLTDANGNYSVAVMAGGDFVVPNNSDLAGFVSPMSDYFNVSSGQAIRENFVVQPITASLSGVVQDNFGNPLGNIELIADPTNDPTGALNESFQSAGNGAFSVGVDGGTWNLFVECNTANNNNLISQYLMVNVANGANISNLVLTAQHATATIYGKVTDSAGHPLSFVSMYANATVGTNNYVSGCVNTDTNGNYSILAFPAYWTVGGNYSGITNENVTVSGTNNALLNFMVNNGAVAPTLSQPVLSGGEFHCQVTGNSSQTYRIDASTNLHNGWTPVYTNIGSFPFNDNVGTNYRSRFYRVVAVP